MSNSLRRKLLEILDGIHGNGFLAVYFDHVYVNKRAYKIRFFFSTFKKSIYNKIKIFRHNIRYEKLHVICFLLSSIFRIIE